jgi:hypothetical protein
MWVYSVSLCQHGASEKLAGASQAGMTRAKAHTREQPDDTDELNDCFFTT